MRSAAIALSFLPAVTMAQDKPPQAAHVHGLGRLAMAVSESEFTLQLKVPSMDIVGFEQPATDEDERARIAGAISDLSKPLELFVVSPEAGCVTASANVARVGDTFAQESDDEGQKDEGGEVHTEFHAEYLIHCQSIEAVKSIHFSYFERFADAQGLQVDFTSASDTHFFTVERQSPLLDLPDTP